jgi:hypothetical protein
MKVLALGRLVARARRSTRAEETTSFPDAAIEEAMGL